MVQEHLPSLSSSAESTSRAHRFRAFVALCLIAPAPSVGVLLGLTLEKSGIGIVLWGLAKVWLLGLPLIWHLFIDKEALSLSRPRLGGFGVGALLGVLISAIIVGAYFAFGRSSIDPNVLRQKLEPLGLMNTGAYIGMAIYTVFVNAALEEYVYRWFVFRKWEVLVGGRLAVIGAALVFVIHHSIILGAYFPTWIMFLGSLGVFVGGLFWSVLYLKYRSIWPGFLSHALVDVAILGIGYWIIHS